MRMAKFCDKCGNPLVNETSKFCDKCGATTVNVKPDIQNQVTDVSQKNYSNNYILVVLLILGILTIFINPIITFLIVVISAILVYYDAKAIGAGKESKKETMDSITWSPFSWALLVLLVWIFILPFYLIKRKEIFFH
jgi:uncharacterized membrane protein YvbJ